MVIKSVLIICSLLFLALNIRLKRMGSDFQANIL